MKTNSIMAALILLGSENNVVCFNLLTTNVPIIETSQLICKASQLTGLYMMGTLVDKRLKYRYEPFRPHVHI